MNSCLICSEMHLLLLFYSNNPNLNLRSFNIALMKDSTNKMWWYGVGDGCNGKIQGTSCGSPSSQCMPIKSEDVATHFNSVPKDFLRKLSFVKVDTEGNDRYILRGLKESLLKVARPLIVIEWFTEFRNCNANARDMFRAIEEIDYVPYGFSLTIGDNKELGELEQATCENYFSDLLLLPRGWNLKDKGVKVCPV